MFQDITTLLLDTEAFKDTIALFVDRYKDKGISVVAGNNSYGSVWYFNRLTACGFSFFWPF